MKIDEMKFHEMPEELIAYANSQIGLLFTQITKVWDYWLEHCVKFVSFTNAGGIIAMLTFMNSRNIGFLSRAGLALSLFAVGLILVGIFILYMFLRFKLIYEKTEQDIDGFYSSKIQWGQFAKNVKERKKFHKLALWLGLGSATCFFIGLVIGIISFITYDCF